MEFNENILTKIKLFGQLGQTIDMLTDELGISCFQLSEYRKNINEVDEALKIYEYNFNQTSISQLYNKAIKAKQFNVAKELLTQMQNNNRTSDNEITIKIVE